MLARLGVSSRRKAEALIAAGRVSVNGKEAHVGQAVSAADVIEVDGAALSLRATPIYLALNKPPGFVTTLKSTHGERTVAELIPHEERLFPVGRLDKSSEGLLLFTNDGEWANLVTHPRYGIPKEYMVEVRHRPSADRIEQLESGIELQPSIITAPAQVSVVAEDRDKTTLSVTVVEGKKRQIRLMFAAIGHPILRLERVRIGAISLDGLSEGAWRRLAQDEVEAIREDAGRAAEPGAAK